MFDCQLDPVFEWGQWQSILTVSPAEAGEGVLNSGKAYHYKIIVSIVFSRFVKIKLFNVDKESTCSLSRMVIDYQYETKRI